MTNQNIKNHSRIVPVYHYLLYTIVIACFLGALWRMYIAYMQHSGRVMSAVVLGLSYAVLLLTWYARSFALVAQDRAIRAEENLRHLALTGKMLHSGLSMRQIIALRFADDTEFVLLAEKAAKENMKAHEIKKSIINWREDNYRV